MLYLTLPKSACTTIKNIMYFLDNGEYYHNPISIHGDGIALLKWDSPDQDKYEAAIRNRKLAFTFVREPFARAYSAFNEKFFHDGRHSFPRPRRYLIEHYGAVFPVEGAEYSPTDHGKNFLRFLDFVQDTIDDKVRIKLNGHWAPQKYVVESHAAHVSIDVVGKLEHFEQTMKYVLDLAKVDAPVDLAVRFNEGPKPPFKLDEIMTDEIHAKLTAVYGVDVDYFGYDSETAKWAR